jgi:hypothetical protein
MNFAMDQFDDDPEVETIGIRMAPTDHGHYVPPIRGPRDMILSMTETMLWASNNAFLSQKNCSRLIDIKSSFPGISFDQPAKEFLARSASGVAAIESHDWNSDLRCLV